MSTTPQSDLVKDIRQLITAFLLRSEGPEVKLRDDDSLVVSGRLSSLQLVELAAALEEKYGIDFIDGFNQYDFDSVNTIVALITAAR